MTPEERRGSFKSIALLTLIPIAGLAVFLIWNSLNEGVTPEEVVKAVATATGTRGDESSSRRVVESATSGPAQPLDDSKTRRLDTSPAARPERASRKSGGGGDIVLIIDDLGFDGQPLEALMTLDPNVNVAILPNGTRAADFAERLNARGFEILCHLPMEPQGRATPGRNAILTSMSDEEIARTTRANVEAVPHARGVNNHMGSRATMDRRVMSTVIRALPDGMYFIDSRTTGGSVAADVARELNVPTATRHVFLDDVATEAAVRKQLAELAEAAQSRGVAIGIGHPYPVTMRVLADELPELKARGFRLVRASQVVR